MASLHCQDGNKRNKFKFSTIRFSSAGNEFSIEPLLHKFKLVVLDSYVFESRDLSGSEAFWTFFSCQDSDTKETFDDSSCTKKSFPTATLMRKLNHVLLWKIDIQYST